MSILRMASDTMNLGPTSNHHTSIAGEFAVLCQLALRGYDANMTVGRTKSVDILVSVPDGRCTAWRSPPRSNPA
jgi:hypothetical protein